MSLSRLIMLVLSCWLAAPMAYGQCTVYTAQELQTALGNVAQCNHRIIIPALNQQSQPVIINAGDSNGLYEIVLTSSHDDLHLTIDGTIVWNDTTVDTNNWNKVIFIDGATDVMIDGDGLLKFVNEPGTTHSPYAHGIRIRNGTNITVDGLTFHGLTSMVEEEGGESTNIQLENLTGTKLYGYGVFWSGVTNGSIENCHVGTSGGTIGTYTFHGFRLYGHDLQVISSSAYNTERRGLWRVDGNATTIDGFHSNRPIVLGPNHACEGGGGPDVGVDNQGNPTARTRRLIARNISTTDDIEGIVVQNGSINALLENIEAPKLTIGNSAGSNVVPRPVYKVYWRNIDVGQINYGSTKGSACISNDVGEVTCLGDITGDGSIGVPDLLAIIGNWGNCAWTDAALGGT